MDDAVYTFEQLLHQSLEEKEGEDLCKTIQRCQDRVIKVKRDAWSGTALPFQILNGKCKCVPFYL